MAFNRTANCLAHDKADAHRFGGVGLSGRQQVDDYRVTTGPKCGPRGGLKVSSAPKPMTGWKHEPWRARESQSTN